jgi:adenylate cyclase
VDCVAKTPDNSGNGGLVTHLWKGQVTLTWEARRAALVARGPSIVRRLRLASGLVLFSYVFLHFLNHSLGNISFEAMEEGARYAEMIWRGPVGGPLLYGAFAIHFSLAFWAIYIRRHLRMGWIEALRLALGLLIPALIVQHAVGQRLSYTLFDVHRVYRNNLYGAFVLNPVGGVRQLIVFAMAWLHGCIGLYLWLRVKSHFGRVAPFLLALAVLVPTMALLGIYQGARQVAEKAQLDPAWLAAARKAAALPNAPAVATIESIVIWFWAGFATLLILVLIARGVRALIERRRGSIRVIYPDGRSVRIPPGLSVLDASRRAGIPHASLCGGRARCSTCRVRVLLGWESLVPPSPAEYRVLRLIGVDRAVRLACQLKPTADISVWPLLPPEITVRDVDRLNVTETGRERFVAIPFIDIRASTQLVENRLPFDVVFILNRFFEAVGHAIIAAGGTPNQFIGDGIDGDLRRRNRARPGLSSGPGSSPPDRLALGRNEPRPDQRAAAADRFRHRHSRRRSYHRQDGLSRARSDDGGRRGGSHRLAVAGPDEGVRLPAGRLGNDRCHRRRSARRFPHARGSGARSHHTAGNPGHRQRGQANPL